jgi:hypothetical protein
MSDNHTPPTPEEMGAKLDEDIKETIQDWAQNPDNMDFDDLDERIDRKLRRTIAGWVGVSEDASWKEIGGKMDSSTRNAIAGWVGAEKDSDWPTISGQIENRVRSNIARLVRARREEGEASWRDIGAKLESDVRGLVGGLVGTGHDSDWQTIGNQVATKARQAFDKAVTMVRGTEKTEESSRSAPVKIQITSEEEGEDKPPVVKSSDPVDPPGV